MAIHTDFIYEVRLLRDDVPGYGHQPEDYRKSIQRYLDTSLGHYLPEVRYKHAFPVLTQTVKDEAGHPLPQRQETWLPKGEMSQRLPRTTAEQELLIKVYKALNRVLVGLDTLTFENREDMSALLMARRQIQSHFTIEQLED